jgi:hypothetical protein
MNERTGEIMTEHYSVDQDLREAEAMTKGLENYLKGDTLYASTGGGFFAFGNMPTLTVGALLMRLRRLGVLRMQLSTEQREHLAELNRQHEAIRSQWRAHYEKKMLWEANSRLDSMRHYFAEAVSPDMAANSYSPEQLRRTIVQELLGAMDDLRIQSADLDTKVNQIDSRLNGIATERTGFLWDSQLEPAYPQKDYWWLYRKPRAGRG